MNSSSKQETAKLLSRKKTSKEEKWKRFKKKIRQGRDGHDRHGDNTCLLSKHWGEAERQEDQEFRVTFGYIDSSRRASII